MSCFPCFKGINVRLFINKMKFERRHINCSFPLILHFLTLWGRGIKLSFVVWVLLFKTTKNPILRAFQKNPHFFPTGCAASHNLPYSVLYPWVDPVRRMGTSCNFASELSVWGFSLTIVGAFVFHLCYFSEQHPDASGRMMGIQLEMIVWTGALMSQST